MARSSAYGAALALLIFVACREPAPVGPISAGVSNFNTAPSSLGWQERARGLVGSANMSPLAAARVYAALSVAQYRAMTATGDSDNDGMLPAEGIVAGGRAALEAHRGAVAGASAAVLSFFFSASTCACVSSVISTPFALSALCDSAFPCVERNFGNSATLFGSFDGMNSSISPRTSFTLTDVRAGLASISETLTGRASLPRRLVGIMLDR